jgi:hypothetical protein
MMMVCANTLVKRNLELKRVLEQLGGLILLQLVAEKTCRRLNFGSHAQLGKTPPASRQKPPQNTEGDLN